MHTSTELDIAKYKVFSAGDGRLQRQQSTDSLAVNHREEDSRVDSSMHAGAEAWCPPKWRLW
jgi:hypothetical protein